MARPAQTASHVHGTLDLTLSKRWMGEWLSDGGDAKSQPLLKTVALYSLIIGQNGASNAFETIISDRSTSNSVDFARISLGTVDCGNGL